MSASMLDYSHEKRVVIVVDKYSLVDSERYRSRIFVIGNYTWWISVNVSQYNIATIMHCNSRESKSTLKCEYVVQLLGEAVAPVSSHSEIQFRITDEWQYLQSWERSDVENYITSNDQLVVEVTVKFSSAEVGDPFDGVNETMEQLPAWTRMLLNNSFLSDVEFIVGPNDTQRRFFGHRHVLAYASNVFKDLLFPPNTSTVMSPMELYLPDVDPTAFMTMLRFIYKRETILDRNKFEETLGVAQDYNVEGFIESLKFLLDKESVIDVLPSIVEIGRQHILWNKTWNVIKNDIKDVIEQQGFSRLPENAMRKILEQDELNIEEIDLWNAYVKWADAQCFAKNVFIDDVNRSRVMKDIDLIRFPTMTVEQFASGPGQSNILSPEDKVSIFSYFLTKSNTRFNVNKRTA